MLLTYQTQWRYRMKLDDIEKAVDYLARTDETHGELTANNEIKKRWQ